MQKLERLLPKAGDRLEKIIMGNCMEGYEKNNIAETSGGSLYCLELWDCEEDRQVIIYYIHPATSANQIPNIGDKSDARTNFVSRTVSTKTRLYSLSVSGHPLTLITTTSTPTSAKINNSM